MEYCKGVIEQDTSVGAHWFKCDSMAAAQLLANSPRANNIALNKGEDVQSDRSGRPRWGVPTFSECREILKKGEWPEGVTRLQRALSDIGSTLTPRSIKRVRVRRELGTEVDITQYWRGRGDIAWTDCKRQSRTARQNITVVVKIGGLAGIPAEALFWRGAAVLKLADMLVTSGYNVELEAVHTSTHVAGPRGFAISIPLKEPTSPLDLNSLAVSVCLAGYFRHSVFKQMCAMPGQPVSSGFGSTCKYRVLVKEEDDNRDMILCDSEVEDLESARRWIEEQVKQIEEGQQI